MNDDFISGQVAMVMNYFAFFPALANEGTNPFADVTGFFANPAGPDGERFAALGGQGMSINAYCQHERKQASLGLHQVVRPGRNPDEMGRTGRLHLQQRRAWPRDEFLKATPYNAAFAETMNLVKDFWNIPEYGELLDRPALPERLTSSAEQGTAQEALDNIAEEQDKILAKRRLHQVVASRDYLQAGASEHRPSLVLALSLQGMAIDTHCFNPDAIRRARYMSKPSSIELCVI